MSKRWASLGALMVPILSAVMGLSAPAQAHPNIGVDFQAAFLFESGQVTGIEEIWVFDEIFSAELLYDFDSDGDGQLDTAEGEAVVADVQPNLVPYRYFTYVWLDGVDIGALPVRDFTASASDGLVVFTFINELPQPVDPRRESLKLQIADREYFVAMVLAETDPVSLQGAGTDGCIIRIEEDPENAYFGFILPQSITLECG